MYTIEALYGVARKNNAEKLKITSSKCPKNDHVLTVLKIFIIVLKRAYFFYFNNR